MKKFRLVITKYKTFLLYLVAGGLTTLVDFSVFILLLLILGEETGLAAMLTERGEGDVLSNVANIAAVLTAVVFAYFINKFMVFQTKRKGVAAALREAAAFFASRGLTTLFALTAYPFLVTLLRLPAIPSKLGITVAVILLNYILSVTVVFKKKN
jgi:putative flippase GtrA